MPPCHPAFVSPKSREKSKQNQTKWIERHRTHQFKLLTILCHDNHLRLFIVLFKQIMDNPLLYKSTNSFVFALISRCTEFVGGTLTHNMHHKIRLLRYQSSKARSSLYWCIQFDNIIFFLNKFSTKRFLLPFLIRVNRANRENIGQTPAARQQYIYFSCLCNFCGVVSRIPRIPDDGRMKTE